jgi:hypothetical protein
MLQLLLHGLMLSLVGVAAIEGLIALWAATSRSHWFIRALGVWGGVMALVPIRAFEPAAFFAISSPVIISLILFTKWLNNRRAVACLTRTEERTASSCRFSLRDLFLLMLLVGLILLGTETIDRGYNWRDWAAFTIAGIHIAAVVALAAALAKGPRRLLFGLLLLAAIAVSPFTVAATAPQSKAELIWQTMGALYNTPFYLPGLIAIGLAHAELAVFIIILTTLSRMHRPRPGRGPLLIAARSAAVLLATIECTWLVWLYWQMLCLSPFPPSVAGASNHYRRIVAISESLGGNHGRGRAPGTDVQSLVDEARVLLRASNYVELDTSEGSLNKPADRNGAASAMREISRAFDTDAKAAAMLGNYDRAAELGIANLRLGAMLSRGGTEVDALVGTSCQNAGMASLIRARMAMSPDSMRSTIAELQRLLAESEGVEIIAARDAAFAERTNGWQARLEVVLRKLIGINSPGAEALGEMRRRAATLNVLLQVDFAVRLFQRDNGSLPMNLTALVPNYLPAVPLDLLSASSRPVCYRFNGDEFVVYSVGHDGKDNGGCFVNNIEYARHWQDADYDYDLDMATRP